MLHLVASASRCLAGLGRDGRRRERLRPGRPVGVAVVTSRAPGGLGALVGHPLRRLVAAPMGRPIVEVAARPGHLTRPSLTTQLELPNYVTGTVPIQARARVMPTHSV